MTQLVFVYGTLKRGYWNNGLLSRAKFLAEGTTVPDTFSMYDGGFPYVTKDGICRIRGEVWEVTDALTMENLDRLEGVPHHYVRKEVEIELDDDEAEPTFDGIKRRADAYMYIASAHTQRSLENNSGRYKISPDVSNIVEWEKK
jgi:gamma-glutamylaminecyclotransferase